MDAALRIELITPFVDALQEAFATLASMDLQRKEIYVKEGVEMFGKFNGIIGLSGGTLGTCVLSLSQEMAEEMVRSRFIMPSDQTVTESAIVEGVGDLVNLIARGAQKRLSSTPYRFEIASPTVLLGDKLRLFHRDSFKCMVIVLENSKGHCLALEVCAESR